MAMLPLHESKGIGGKLLTKVETWLESEGCKKIWLTTDLNQKLRAYSFYRRHGWDDWKTEHGLRYMSKVFAE